MNNPSTVIGFPSSIGRQYPYSMLSKYENIQVKISAQDLITQCHKEDKIGPLKIVLADDDLDDRDLFEEAVRKLGAEVVLHTVNDGAELLKLLGSGESLPDIIFLDLNMPNKNGRECLAEIRSRPELNHLNIIIYSTSSSSKDIEDTFEIGANLYVCKPSSFKGLKEMISKVINLDWENQKPKVLMKNYVYPSQGS